MKGYQTLRHHATRLSRPQILAIATGLALIAVDPVAAAGACDVPNASNGINQGGQLLRSILVLAGIFVGGKSMISSRSGGSHGKAGSRKTLGVAIGLLFAGAALPQLAGWVLGMFGSSLSDVGLGCMF
ncbi:hypothetical protein [Haladaptatus halobius]|uniref:hypothetical protein n=1 Tax=Haladaptatus halobius TaxID=2884875 RepID=UPI001D09F0D3|nr:hypothetical protein [Haladaptatus halobius]